MPPISAVFFAFGVVAMLVGMSLGMHMGASGDFTLMPVHAHLNLLGFVVMAVYGTFYALVKSFSEKLAWINFGFSAAGVLVMTPFLALMLSSGDESLEPFVAIGGALAMIGLITFGVSVFKEVTRAR
jgi:hypothetical protein